MKIYMTLENRHVPQLFWQRKKILPEMDKKDITVVNNTNGIIVTDSMEIIDALLLEQRPFVKTK